MNKLITKTIRAGFVFAVAIFAVTNTAFAYAVIIPGGVTDITNTTATLNAQISNQGENSSGWFELSNNASFYPVTIVGQNSFMGSGSLVANLDNLIPGATYYYRAAVIARPVFGSADAPVYSSIASFQTRTPSAATNNNALNQATTGSNTQSSSASNGSAQNTATSGSSNKNTSANGSQNGFTNGNSAAVIGAGDGIFPTTLIGWISLFILIIIILLVVRLIYEESEKRKKARAAQKLIDDAKAAAAKEEAKGIK